MWIILVNKDLSESRDNVISSLLNDDKDLKEMYLYMSNGKYYETSSINSANVWKTKSGAQRIVNLFKREIDYSKSSYNYREKFRYLWHKHLRVRELTKDEFNSTIDKELERLDNSYKRRRDKIESKKIK